MNITGLTVKRKITWEEIREVCMEHQYYTRGDVASYEKMFTMAKSDMQDEDYIKIAWDIFNHSDIDRMCNEYGIDEEECIRIILSNLINASWNIVDITTEKGLGE